VGRQLVERGVGLERVAGGGDAQCGLGEMPEQVATGLDA